jgi:uncharacterized protein YgiM (DUF1202 family)
MKDFYYILGTRGNASAAEIEAAYQKLARKFADEEDAFMDAHFREISEAYDTLRDDRRRRKYDAALRRSQRWYLATFRLKYLNIALTLTFLVVTALFAWYVVRSIQGHPQKIAPKPVVQPAAVVATPAHIKKQHKIVSARKPGTVPAANAEIKPSTPVPAPYTEVARSAPRKNPDSTYTATLHANVTGIVYLHQSADYGSAVLAKLPNATQVRVLQKGDLWYKVSYNRQEGYVIKSAVGR